MSRNAERKSGQTSICGLTGHRLADAMLMLPGAQQPRDQLPQWPQSRFGRWRGIVA
jgi:hypothetical protein